MDINYYKKKNYFVYHKCFSLQAGELAHDVRWTKINQISQFCPPLYKFVNIYIYIYIYI